MAAAVLTPRVRMMAICDRVRKSKIEADVFHLKGVRQWIAADVFPYFPSQLWLFLVLTCPRSGEFPGYVRVVQDKTDKASFFGKLEPRPTFGANNDLWATRASIRGSFPEVGRYTVQVWFFQEQGSDVLKGELPFSILKESA